MTFPGKKAEATREGLNKKASILVRENARFLVPWLTRTFADQKERRKTRMSEAKEPSLPRTIEEAVEYLLSVITEADKTFLRDMEEGDLIQLHLGWGMGIRNGLGLWGRNDALLKACGTQHADTASMVIIHAVWQRLQEHKGPD